MAETQGKVNEMLDDLSRCAEQGEEVTVGQITESLGHRGFGPFLVVPALIEITPLGGIPGVPSLLALIIVLFAGQIALGRKHMWLPGFLERREIEGDKVRKSAQKLRPLARWLDRWFHERLPRFAGSGSARVAAALVIALCLTVPPLELIPFASSAPMLAIAMIGLALTLRDGALMLAAYAVAAIGFVVVGQMLLS
ncbi:putative exoD-like membrane protein [Pseudooceanicola batsensis HTCC2597]|uniref:Putative exoD-like membrane protein n=1 Tax=Pseudooceanicola batsensis (strain ATCC BAA-863 / DSM 15984 / KCTC 12145 / HTCC2597) TaxID=252305 RepID=A3U314_PSEBH|nr:exopolysaccharide biosynthesis protein [Pseudooceanicola batsensis]EAQ01544.1 putative exoD-like membrane protein [Pseudooceanicola batsensis HTCC2597]